jgi:hypothetical protein
VRAAAVIAALLVGVALTAALVWNAAEAHYKNCVETAQSLPDRRTQREILRAKYRAQNDPHAEAVNRRVQGCSRLP